MASASEFFAALYEGVGAGFIEIRPLLDDEDVRRGTEEGKRLQAKARRYFRWPSETQNALKYIQAVGGKDFHMYFGVAPRKDSSSGTKKNIGCCTAVFADVDFKDVEPEVARKLLGEFPCKPSIVVKSGNGLHVYWLLKEPIMESGFPRLEIVNRAMLKYMRAQVGTQDASRILRIPGTANIKKKYPDPKPVTTVSYWHPEFRYDMDDFEKYLPPEDLVQTKTYVLAPKGASAGNGQSNAQAPGAPSFELEDSVIDECAGLLSKVWLDGYRHNIALHVAGWCAHAGYSEASAEKLMLHICAAAGDVETDDRITTVKHSYQKFMAGERVAGFSALEKMAKDSLPEILHEQMAKVIQMLRKSMPKSRKSAPTPAPEDPPMGPEQPGTASTGGRGRAPRKWGGGRRDDPLPNFTLIKYNKFKSNPPQYSVTIEKDGAEHVVTCEGRDLLQYTNFQQVFFQQTDRTLNMIGPDRWSDMIDACQKEMKEAPPESTRVGALEGALEEFLANAKEKSDPGLLRSAPGYDEEDHFFKFHALRQFVGDSHIKVEDATLYHHIKMTGWHQKTKRFGKTVVKVWAKHFDESTALPPEPEKGPAGPPEAPTKGGPTSEAKNEPKMDLFEPIQAPEGVMSSQPLESA